MSKPIQLEIALREQDLKQTRTIQSKNIVMQAVSACNITAYQLTV